MELLEQRDDYVRAIGTLIGIAQARLIFIERENEKLKKDNQYLLGLLYFFPAAWPWLIMSQGLHTS